MQQLRFINPSSKSRGPGKGGPGAPLEETIEPFLVQFGRASEGGGSWVTYARDFPHTLELDEHRQAKVCTAAPPPYVVESCLLPIICHCLRPDADAQQPPPSALAGALRL